MVDVDRIRRLKKNPRTGPRDETFDDVIRRFRVQFLPEDRQDRVGRSMGRKDLCGRASGR